MCVYEGKNLSDFTKNSKHNSKEAQDAQDLRELLGTKP